MQGYNLQPLQNVEILNADEGQNEEHFYEWTAAGMKKDRRQKEHFHLRAVWFDEF